MGIKNHLRDYFSGLYEKPKAWEWLIGPSYFHREKDTLSDIMSMLGETGECEKAEALRRMYIKIAKPEFIAIGSVGVLAGAFLFVGWFREFAYCSLAAGLSANYGELLAGMRISKLIKDSGYIDLIESGD